MFSAKKSPAGKNASIATLISECCEVEGNLSSKSSIKIEGKISGNVVSASSVIVATGGKVLGDIKCNDLMIYGEVEGNVSCQELHLCSSGKLVGQIQTDSLHVEPGGKYQGAVSMSTSAPQPSAKPLKKVAAVQQPDSKTGAQQSSQRAAS